MLSVCEWAKLSERACLIFFPMSAQSDLVLMNWRSINLFRWSSFRRGFFIPRLQWALWRRLLRNFCGWNTVGLNVLNWNLLLKSYKLRHRLNIDHVNRRLMSKLNGELGIQLHLLSVNRSLRYHMRLKVTSWVLLKPINWGCEKRDDWHKSTIYHVLLGYWLLLFGRVLFLFALISNVDAIMRWLVRILRHSFVLLMSSTTVGVLLRRILITICLLLLLFLQYFSKKLRLTSINDCRIQTNFSCFFASF